MGRNYYRVWRITAVIFLLALLGINLQVAISAGEGKPEDIYAEAEKLFEAENYEQALPLYNKLLDKPCVASKFVSDHKSDIETRKKYCEKKLGIISDIRSLFNGKAILTKKGQRQRTSCHFLRLLQRKPERRF